LKESLNVLWRVVWYAGIFPAESRMDSFIPLSFLQRFIAKKMLGWRLLASPDPRFLQSFAGKIAARIPNNSATQCAARKDATLIPRVHPQ